MYQQTALVHAWLFLKFFPTFFLRFLRGGLNNNASPSSSNVFYLQRTFFLYFFHKFYSLSIFHHFFSSFLALSHSFSLKPPLLLCLNLYLSLFYMSVSRVSCDIARLLQHVARSLPCTSRSQLYSRATLDFPSTWVLDVNT